MAQSTDGTRSKIGFRQGRHAWEVIWEGPLGTVILFVKFYKSKLLNGTFCFVLKCNRLP